MTHRSFFARAGHVLRPLVCVAALSSVASLAGAGEPVHDPAVATGAPAVEPAGRPRIGLVLSGGGARGAAHVGVIRALEQLHVPIDAVAGTSMGAVVGGLYAAGLSGEEIERVFRELDWQEMIRDRAPRRDLAYRRKQDDRNILARGALGVDVGEGVVLPLGLVQGQKINQALRKATARVADVQDFDRLPTPFRALATDLETGEPIVLGQGDLVTVLRASMSAPGVLTPVEVDGRLLVDGGLVDNLPVELAQTMGVDRLIVVDVSFPLAKRDDFGSAFDITNQMIGIMVRRGTLESKKHLQPGDVLIEPDLGAMTTLDFARTIQVMDLGRDAALVERAELAALALPQHEYERYAASRVRAAEPSVRIAYVQPSERSQVESRRIEAVFGDLVGRKLDSPELQRRLATQYRLDQFESVDYRVVGNERERGLEIDLRRKSWGPSFLRLGVGVENDYEGGATANAAARLWITGLNWLDAEWTFDGQIGEEPLFRTEFYQPLSLRTPVFVAPALRYETQSRPLMDEKGERIARYRVRDTEVSLAVGAELSVWGEVRTGLRYGDGSARILVGDPSLPAGDYDLGGAFVEFGYDRLDSAVFPREGQAFRASWLADRESLGATRDADVVHASWQMARSRDRYSVVWSMDAGSALDDEVVSPQELFTLGGLFDISGLAPDAMSGTQYGIARGIVYRRISRGGTGFFEFPAYLGFSVEAGNVWQTRDDVDWSDLQTGGSLFLGAESPFGPVYLAAGLASGGETAFYLYVGKTF
ncbi:MAG TPA: patatin-like phospholipase family protein [Steroidobacteraceae bacterium]|nr:patatin-like phospholipase family protein [Steroidobacteraceae bacterium]